jgi:hypothetical protein
VTDGMAEIKANTLSLGWLHTHSRSVKLIDVTGYLASLLLP